MRKRRYFISFIGGIGTGKTSGAEIIAKNLGFTLIKERFTQNNFLPYFYKDMKTWAFNSQLFFLVEKLNQLLFIKNKLRGNSIVQDVSICQDVFIYMEAQKILNNVSNEDYKIYHKIYKKAMKLLPHPDLLIYLKWPPEYLARQIKKRGRSYEKSIHFSYLKLLHKLLERWIAENSKDFLILTIDTQNLNFVKKYSHKKEFIGLIKKFLK